MMAQAIRGQQILSTTDGRMLLHGFCGDASVPRFDELTNAPDTSHLGAGQDLLDTVHTQYYTVLMTVEARELIASSSRIAVLTGAGISTDSGIPDFRGPNGVWTLDPDAERLSDIYHYKNDPEVRRKSWERYTSQWGTYEPNAGHLALKRLYDDGRLLHITTQNIDRLHHASGIPCDYISELHGNREELSCLGCGRIFWTHQQRFYAGDDAVCSGCGGLLKPNIVFFGENLNPQVWTRAVNAATECDLYLVVGTSLQVWPAADLPTHARGNDTPVIYVNGESARQTRMERINCIGSISEILTEIIPT